MDNDENCCWICLQTDSTVLGPLEQPCACPRLCHVRCLSRWQLQSAGRSEETHCRFCSMAYSDWRQHLGPRADSGGLPPRPATPIMAIFFEGQTHRIKVYPGPDGKARFEQQIRDLIQLNEQEDFDIAFECKAPDTGGLLHLAGMNAFDAATHCAALTAAERLSKQQELQSQAEQRGQQANQQRNLVQEVQQQHVEMHSPPDYSDEGQQDADQQDVDQDDIAWQQHHQQPEHPPYTGHWYRDEAMQYTSVHQQYPAHEGAFDASSVPIGVGYQYVCPLGAGVTSPADLPLNEHSN